MSLSELINKNYDKLNESDIYFFNFVRDNMESFQKMKISTLAKQINMSSAGIIKASQKLGFDGFSEFKYYIANEVRNRKIEYKNKLNLNKQSIILSDVVDTSKLYSQNNQIEDIVNCFNNCKRVFAFGTGFSQQLMIKEFIRCMFNDHTMIVYIPTITELENLCSDFDENDLLLFVSFSGDISEKAINILKQLKIKKVNLVSVSIFTRNTLAKMCDYNLYYQVSTISANNRLNTSSYITLNLVLALLYESIIRSKLSEEFKLDS